MMLSARQIKAARALLDWGQEDLAAASGLSSRTIINIENGDGSARLSTYNIIRLTFENAGVEFEARGVFLSDKRIKVIDGADSCDVFFNDVVQTVRDTGGEISCGFQSWALMALMCSNKRGDLGHLKRLCELVPVKCLIADTPKFVPLLPSLEIRTLPRHQVCFFSFIEYGAKYAIVSTEGPSSFSFAIFNAAGMAVESRKRFMPVWENASPLVMQQDDRTLVVA